MHYLFLFVLTKRVAWFMPESRVVLPAINYIHTHKNIYHKKSSNYSEKWIIKKYVHLHIFMEFYSFCNLNIA